MVQTRCVVFFGLMLANTPAVAQVNSWLKSSNGAWHEAQWSLGVLPGAGQLVYFTNAGSKTLTIDATTTGIHSQSLTVHSLNIGSSGADRNHLVLGNAGTNSPLACRFMLVGSNSAITVAGSALQLFGNGGEGMSVGGELIQNPGSSVTGQQFDVGYVGPGRYVLNGGHVAVNHGWVGGPFNGAFHQSGGSNGIGIVHLDPGGKYSLAGGDFNATVYFNSTFERRSVLHQTGGRIQKRLELHKGDYFLADGINEGGIVAPVGDGWSAWSGDAEVIQTGGTNFGPVDVGYFGWGSYTLSNGVVYAPMLTIGALGHYEQWGGVQIIANSLRVLGAATDRNYWSHGSYSLHGGRVSADNMFLDGTYTQTGGTNLIAGQVTVQAAYTLGDRLRIAGGLFAASDVTAFRGITVTGGRLVVLTSLHVYGTGWQRPDLNVTGGELSAFNIILHSGKFVFASGTIAPGTRLTLSSGMLMPQPGNHEFGAIHVEPPEGGAASEIVFPPEDPCQLRLAIEPAPRWAENATLLVRNWSGAPFGGGMHQLRFGIEAAALSPEQVRQIVFVDPAGLAPGSYLAKLLPDREVVPDALPPTGRVSPTLRLTIREDDTVRLTVFGEAGADYAFEASTNASDWIVWTNRVATSGTVSVVDAAVTNHNERFYRAYSKPPLARP